MHSLLEERWELDLIHIAYWEVNLRAVRLQFQRQDGEFEERIGRGGEVPTSCLHLEAKFTESNTVIYQQKQCWQTNPQNKSSANTIDDKDNTGYYFKVLDTIVYKLFLLKFHPVQQRASER